LQAWSQTDKWAAHMHWLRELMSSLRFLFGQRQEERRLKDELQFHLQRQIEQNLAAGMLPQEARYAALRLFGGVQQITEECRDMRRVNYIENFLQDVRYGVRQLGRSSGFTAVAVITLALGIGANTAIFSVVDGVLLRSLPYAAPDQLVSAAQFTVPRGFFVAVRERSRTMDIAAYSYDAGINLSGRGEAVRLLRGKVSVSLFELLGVNAALGRVFRRNEERDEVVILSHALWEQRFGSDPRIIGRWITLDEVSRQVVGVMPASFSLPWSQAQLWMPLDLDPAKLWGDFEIRMIGRLHPGVSISLAQAELRALIPGVDSLMPWRMPERWGHDAQVIPLVSYTVSDVRSKLLILLGAVGLVLLIACANVVNLVLGKTAGRRREIAVRAALGADRSRIVWQLLTESVLLALGGGAVGLAIGFKGTAFLKMLLPANTPRLASVAIDWRVLIFTASLVILTGVVFGLAPALTASRLNLEQELKANAERTGVGTRQRLVSSALVVTEVALAVVVVVGAGLLARSLWALTQRDTGIQPEHLLTAHINQIGSRCRGGCVNFYNDLMQRASGLPGVQSVAAAEAVPGGGVYPTALSVEGHPDSVKGAHPLQAWSFVVTPGYVRTMGIPLLRGRDLTDADRAGSQEVVLLSASAARQFWPGQEPIGKRVKLSWRDNWRVVVGVVGDVREYGLANNPEWGGGAVGDIYFPYAQGTLDPGWPPAMTMLVRSQRDPVQLAESLRTVVSRLDANVPVSEVRTMNGVLSGSVAEPRSTAWLFLSFAMLALALGTIGVYSVVSYSVVERIHEIGVRMALGALKRDVLTMVLKEGMRLTVLGVAIGLMTALTAGQVISTLLYGVKSHDPLTLLAVSAVIPGVAFLACYVPARRATKFDPMVALRYE
jgi:predicted permease